VDTTIPKARAGRQVVLAEPASGRWRASLNDVPLQSFSSAGLQAFTLPAGGGRLEISVVDDRHRLLQTQGIALVAVVLLALPLGRRRRTVEVVR
jgi:hypothetical protein